MKHYITLSEKRGSNPRPRPWQGRALPAELFSHYFILKNVDTITVSRMQMYYLN